MPTPCHPSPPILYVDSASPIVAVGLQVGKAPDPALWRRTKAGADVGMFQETATLLHRTGLEVADLRSVVFCEGPGSMLGIRLAAMMIRTWSVLPRPMSLQVYGYRSLALFAASLLEGGEPPPFKVITDARRQSWNVLTVSASGSFGPTKRIPAAEFGPDGLAVLHPDEFRSWQPLPDFARPAAYNPESVSSLAEKYALLHDADAPDAYVTEMPVYRTWQPNQTPSGPPHA